MFRAHDLSQRGRMPRDGTRRCVVSSSRPARSKPGNRMVRQQALYLAAYSDDQRVIVGLAGIPNAELTTGLDRACPLKPAKLKAVWCDLYLHGTALGGNWAVDGPHTGHRHQDLAHRGCGGHQDSDKRDARTYDTRPKVHGTRRKSNFATRSAEKNTRRAQLPVTALPDIQS
jgi:hypothetical protein